MKFWGCWNDQIGGWEHPSAGEDAEGYPVPMTLADARAHVKASKGDLVLAGFAGAYHPIFNVKERTVEAKIALARRIAAVEARDAARAAPAAATKFDPMSDPLVRCIFR